MNIFEIGLIIWVIFASTLWLVIRSVKPEWLGLEKNINKQIIDNVKVEKCPKCDGGYLKPQLAKSIRVRGLPVFNMYIKNQKLTSQCNNCKFTEKKYYKYKRISLTNKVYFNQFSNILFNFCIAAIIICFAIMLFFK